MSSADSLVSVRQQLAVLGTCIVAALACSGAVTSTVLLIYVLPGCLVTGLLAVLLSRTVGLATASSLAVLTALGLAQLTNLSSGDTSGPVARSTFLTAGCTALAVVLSRRAAPLLVALPVGGVLGSALWLGAADEVVPVLGAVVACLVIVLPSLARADRREIRRRRRLVVPTIAVLTVVAAVGADRVQEALVHGPPVTFDAAQVDGSIIPAGRSEARSGSPTITDAARPTATPLPAADSAASGVRWWPLVAFVLALLVVAILLRGIWASARRQRRRRRLRGGDPVSATLGAWHWTFEQLLAYGVAAAPTVTPDELALGRQQLNLPGAAQERLRSLAAQAAYAGFAATRRPSAEDAITAWAVSGEVLDAVRSTVPWPARLRSRLL